MNNLEIMRKRLEHDGGIRQEDRMIKAKYRTLLDALKYSYQSCEVKAVQKRDQTDDDKVWRALINPDKINQDYDNKILSIDYASQINTGDIIEWVGTDSKWLVYLQALTEDAYFRSEIRRCKYQIRFKGEDNSTYTSWAALKGPTESKIDNSVANELSMDSPNYTLHLLLPLSDINIKHFTRYTKFLLNGKAWRVEGTDEFSTPNILEVYAKEYYIDPAKDDVEQEIADGLVVEPIDPNPIVERMIVGETFIKPMITEVYTAPETEGVWMVKEKFPVTLKSISDLEVEVTWQKPVSGQFTLCWIKGEETIEKTIVVESLF